MSAVFSLAVAALVVLALWVLVFISSHIVRRADYDYLHNAVSDFGVGRSWPLYWLQNVLLAAAAILVDVALYKTLHGIPGISKRVNEGLVALAIFAGARLGTCLFPTIVTVAKSGSLYAVQLEAEMAQRDALGRGRPTHVLIHVLLAMVMFVAAAVGTMTWSYAVSHGGFPGPLYDRRHVLLGLAIALVVCLGLMVLTMWLRRCCMRRSYFGAPQRAVYLAFVAWLFVAAVSLVQQTK